MSDTMNSANAILISATRMDLRLLMKEDPRLFLKISIWLTTLNYNFTEEELSHMKRLGLVDNTGRATDHLKPALILEMESM
jgi:hypothetical protein